ncbi:hypothetical protein BH09BAC5_BH09BAC5_25690 [soil metagenome]
MTPVHFHLMLNHVAIMAALFSSVIFIAGMFRKNETVKNIALYGFILSAIVAIPVFLTGEPSEDAVENLPGVLKNVIEAHEDAAAFAVWMIGAAGIFSLMSLMMKKVQWFRSASFSMVMALIAVVSAGSISYTGYLGGKIRHTEIAGNVQLQNAVEMQGGETEEDD